MEEEGEDEVFNVGEVDGSWVVLVGVDVVMEEGGSEGVCIMGGVGIVMLLW